MNRLASSSRLSRYHPQLVRTILLLVIAVAAVARHDEANAQIAASLEPTMKAVAEKAGHRSVLVLTMPGAGTQQESWGVLGVVYDESVRLLAERQVPVLVAPKVTELIESGKLRASVNAAWLRRVRELATFELLLTEVYTHNRSVRTVEIVLYDGSSGEILGRGKRQLRDHDVRPEVNVSEMSRNVVAFAASQFGQQVGTGECWTLAAKACERAGACTTGLYCFGRKLGPLDSPLPGDILQLEQAKFQGSGGGSWSFSHHTAVVETVSSPTVVTVLHQNFGQAGKKVSRATLHLDQKTQGTLDVFRPRPKVLKAIEPRSADESLQQVPPTVSVTIPGGAVLSLRPIPAGKFRMGRGEDANAKLYQVTLTKPFHLGLTEVTQGQWKAVMGKNPSEVQGDDLPVTNVSWNDAQEFCKALNQSPAGERFRFRLPTEGEWEYACRAGTATRYCFGDDALEFVEYGWYQDNSGGRPHSVAKLRPNRWGLHDMHGNVWELIQDVFTRCPGGDPPEDQIDPVGPMNGRTHVMRGGAFGATPGFCSCANRGNVHPTDKGPRIGFRVAAVAK